MRKKKFICPGKLKRLNLLQRQIRLSQKKVTLLKSKKICPRHKMNKIQKIKYQLHREKKAKQIYKMNKLKTLLNK